jgi:hypothetical protein
MDYWLEDEELVSGHCLPLGLSVVDVAEYTSHERVLSWLMSSQIVPCIRIFNFSLSCSSPVPALSKYLHVIGPQLKHFSYIPRTGPEAEKAFSMLIVFFVIHVSHLNRLI